MAVSRMLYSLVSNQPCPQDQNNPLPALPKNLQNRFWGREEAFSCPILLGKMGQVAGGGKGSLCQPIP